MQTHDTLSTMHTEKFRFMRSHMEIYTSLTGISDRKQHWKFVKSQTVSFEEMKAG